MNDEAKKKILSEIGEDAESYHNTIVKFLDKISEDYTTNTAGNPASYLELLELIEADNNKLKSNVVEYISRHNLEEEELPQRFVEEFTAETKLFQGLSIRHNLGEEELPLRLLQETKLLQQSALQDLQSLNLK